MRRRDLLHTFLGAPLAAAACRSRSSSSRLPDGQLVHRSETRGHQLRDHRGALEPAADAWEDASIVIVGGGVAGLSAAWRLARQGREDVLLLELGDVLGGTAKSGSGSIGAYPWGAHYITAPMALNAELVALLREMDVVEGTDARGEPVVREQHLCRDPSERVFYLGRWYEGLYLHAGASAEDRRQLKAFEHEVGRWAAWKDGSGRRAFALPMASGSDDAEVTALDRISIAEWLARRKLDSPRLRWYVDYACRDDYGLTLDQTSAWAALFYFAARLPAASAEYRPVVTWPEGNGRLVRHLASALPTERRRTGWAVGELRPSDGGVDVIALTDGGRTLRGVHAKQVIFAAPRFTARYLIRDWRDRPPAHLNAFEYGAWMVANLHLKKRPGGLGFPLCWDNVLYQSPSLGYVVSTHQRGLDHGGTVITYYYPLLEPDGRASRKRLLGAGWRDWAEVVMSDLGRAHPNIRSITERIDIVRFGHAMIRPRPGFIWGSARRAAAKPYRNIHFAHSDLSGVALFEEAFHRGITAADAVRSV